MASHGPGVLTAGRRSVPRVVACWWKRDARRYLATSRLVGEVLGVMLLQHPGGQWAAHLSPDSSMSAETILEAVSDRWAIEEHFHDVQENWGAGEQQVRNVWSNIGCWNLCGWLYPPVELASCDRPAGQLVDRTDRPWDNPTRPPSPANRRRPVAREMLRNECPTDLPEIALHEEFQQRLLRLHDIAV